MTADDDLTPEQREAIEFVALRAMNGYRAVLREKVESLETFHNMVWKQDVLALLDGGTE